ncbi:MAG: ROK family protein [Ignavibacteriales bacterium]|nr:ROK family protein [Ignavibacteriales bacterium]
MLKKKYAVGVDLGGTSIKIGLVDSKGKIFKKVSLDSCASNGPKAVIEQIVKGIRLITNKKNDKILGIGIGAPGAVKLKKGTVENPPNFPNWGKVHLGNAIKEKFDCDIYVENDANAAAIGEMIYGAGEKFENFIMITLGTGVGGGIIINKKIYRGETGGAGEIGHVTIDYKGPQCKCGSFGCIESYIGNNYLIDRVKKQLQSRKDSLLIRLTNNDLNLLTPQLIHQAAEDGDDFARSIIVDCGLKLGYVLASIVNVLDISTIVIGGGVAGFGKLLFDTITYSIKERVIKPSKEQIVVKPAKLKNNAGIKGASALVFYKP